MGCSRDHWTDCKLISFSIGASFGIGVTGTLGPVEFKGHIVNVGGQATLSQTAGGATPVHASVTSSAISGTIRVGSREGEASLVKCESGEGCHLGSVGMKSIDVESNGDVGASVQVGVKLGVTVHFGQIATAVAAATSDLYATAKNWFLTSVIHPNEIH